MVLPVGILVSAGILLYAGLHNMSIGDALRHFLGRPGKDGKLFNGSTSAASSGGAPSAAAVGGGGYSALVGPGLTYAGPDQGIDFTGRGGVYAINDSRVISARSSGTGWPGQGALVVLLFTAGQYAGHFWYIAEDFDPQVHAGQRLSKGQLIGLATGSGRAPGIEVGFASGPNGSAYGTVRDGKPGGPAPVHGIAMANYVQSESAAGSSPGSVNLHHGTFA